MSKIIYLYLQILLLLIISTTTASAEKIHISVAGSLTNAVKEIIRNYQQLHPTIKLLPNFASSGTLTKQISAGAPAAIYISANPKWMDYLQQQGLIAPASKKILLHNSMVFVSIAEEIKSLADLSELKQIAIGNPKSVPAGSYAAQALKSNGNYQQLLAAKKLVMTKDVRQALLYADRGEADGAFVYRTDALLATKAKVLFTVPQHLHPAVTYPAALTINGATNVQAVKFYTYLRSTAAQQVFRNYGFSVAEKQSSVLTPGEKR